MASRGTEYQPSQAPGALAAFLAGVFALKLLVVLQLRDHPLVQPDVGLDTTAYVELARRVLAGDLALGPGLYYVSPLYIYFLAATLAATDAFTAVRVVQVLLGTLSVLFVFLTAKEWYGARAAWLAAALAALTGLFTFYEALLFQAALDPFLASASLLALARALSRGGPRRYLLCGLLFGIATLNRPNFALAAACLALALLAARRMRPAALLLAGVLAGLAPVAIRNVVVTGEWALVSSQGGLNFYIGNGEGATGFYRQVRGIRPTIDGQALDARRVAERAAGRSLSDTEVSDYFYDQAWSWIRQHPASALALVARKLGYAFIAQHIALPYSYPFYAYDAGTALRFYAVGPWLLVPLGLVGLLWAAPASRRSEYLIWIAFVPAYAIAVAVFFVSERYRLPLLVPLCVGAGAAVDLVLRRVWLEADKLSTGRLGDNRRSGGQEAFFRRAIKFLLISLSPVSLPASRVLANRHPRLLAPAAVFVALFTYANWPRALHDGRWEEGLRMAQRLVILGRYDEANEWARRLETGAPRPGLAAYGIGMQYREVGQPALAVEHLERARQLDPDQAIVHYGLGQALLDAGRAREAIEHLRRGFDAGVDVPLAGYDLAVALERVGDYPAAAAVVRRIVPREDDDHEAWLKIGRLASRVKAPAVAEPFFRRAVEMRPDQAGARKQYGLNLLLLGRHEEAARELAAAVRLDPRDPDSLAHLAYSEYQLGRTTEALAHAEAALSLNPEDRMAKPLAAALRRLRDPLP